MLLVELVREIFAAARAQKIPTVMVLLLAGAMCTTTLLTVGRAAAAEDQVATRLEAAGSRHLVLNDARSVGFLTEDLITLAATHSTVERAVGLTIPTDTTNGQIRPGGTKIPTWQVIGALPDVVTLTAGRWPAPGEALITTTAQQRLGLDHPTGWFQTTTGAQYPIVGSFAPRPPFEDFCGDIGGREPTENEWHF